MKNCMERIQKTRVIITALMALILLCMWTTAVNAEDKVISKIYVKGVHELNIGDPIDIGGVYVEGQVTGEAASKTIVSMEVAQWLIDPFVMANWASYNPGAPTTGPAVADNTIYTLSVEMKAADGYVFIDGENMAYGVTALSSAAAVENQTKIRVSEDHKTLSFYRGLQVGTDIHTHTGSAWECTSLSHSQRCSICSKPLDSAEHIFKTEDGCCIACGYKDASKINSASSVYCSGKTNGGMQWSVDKSGTLSIKGTGISIDYGYDFYPWEKYGLPDLITCVKIDASNMTMIGPDAFVKLSKLQKMSITGSKAPFIIYNTANEQRLVDVADPANFPIYVTDQAGGYDSLPWKNHNIIDSHNYTYSSTRTVKATLTKDGAVYKKYRCSSCEDEKEELTSTIPKVSKVKLSKTSYLYDGKEHKPEVVLTAANGTKLVKNTHYKVKYDSGRTNPGTYKVTITLKGKYKGTKVLRFKIRSDAKVTVYKTGFSYETITTPIQKRMKGKSFKTGGKMKWSDLRYVRLKYYDLNGVVAYGEIVVNKKIALKTTKIFYELYKIKYKMESVRLVDDFGASDTKSMEANNTSAFNYRTMAGSKKLSKHGYGLAIDINPKFNPLVKGNTVKPSNGKAYKQRTVSKCKGKYKKLMIHKNDKVYKIFRKYGFRWGGNWTHSKDYQHFEY